MKAPAPICASRERASMKVPPKRKGNCQAAKSSENPPSSASMKVPPKRKGNVVFEGGAKLLVVGLNESPSEKEGKWGFFLCVR